MIYVLLFVLSNPFWNPQGNNTTNGGPVQLYFKTMEECMKTGNFLHKTYGNRMGPSVCIAKEKT